MSPFIIATIGGETGAKTHEHPLSAAGQAQISIWGGAVEALRVGSATNWNSNRRLASSDGGSSTTGITLSPALMGSTDSASTVQPSFVARYIIRAA